MESERRGLDIIANKAMSNQDLAILHSPISVEIEVVHHIPDGSNNPSASPLFNYSFGYEQFVEQEPIKSRGIIKILPERAYLKAINVYYEQGPLPIVAFFPDYLNIQRYDTISAITSKYNTGTKTTDKYKDVYTVIDIREKGAFQAQSMVYILAPQR